MAKVLCVILAVLASFMLVESLDCNQCSVGVLGVCLNSDVVTCTNNSNSQCFTGRACKSTSPTRKCFQHDRPFPNIASSVGINLQGCRENCTAGTTNTTVLGATLSTVVQCCDTDKCNPVTISGATTTTTLSLAAVLASALLASAWSTV
ncbi:hypothetical protein N1851_021324 [Merluccius polli]|uniref:UPAR/Ly6 domain-containing protein n=1 Tax=Merluccius polli TaxID=89951 RepID=A0AA47NWP7_MERPO|nr:hypothetical protein N1851_029175 [Merluccius polli]KAK0141526.1 hypothetical protein N1851_021324 [Merluccius polli]